jgi:hypothetical protein
LSAKRTSPNAFGDEVGVVGSKRPAKLFRRDFVEIRTNLLDGVGEIVDFCFVWLEVQVFEKDFLAGVGSVLRDTL